MQKSNGKKVLRNCFLHTFRSKKALCFSWWRGICMYKFLKQVHVSHRPSLPYYSHLIDRCLSLKSLNFSKIIHAQLIKVGFSSHTFLGNRCLDLYSKFGTLNDVMKVFGDISNKNCVSWNVCLKGLLNFGQFERARRMFDEMPIRDVVSWNSMISGSASYGFVDYALQLSLDMQNSGVRPSAFTFSILVSVASCAPHGKEIHGSMIRSGMNLSNVVLGNSLIDMYGKFGLVDYAFSVFFTMEELDIISWNSLIWGCYRSGYSELALEQFSRLNSTGHWPDEFTVSTIITVCSNLQDLEKGKQILAVSVKGGFVSNTIVSSATIDLFSECNRLEDSVLLFQELDHWDSAVCNSMISSYARHGFGDNALQLFLWTLRADIMPTEFTLSCILSPVSILPVELGGQVHSMVVKFGFESDAVVASSLVDMYTKFGLIESAMEIFSKMDVRDLISWNTMIMGLTYNGRLVETLDIFKELLRVGPSPDRITLAGVLLACNFGGFVDEGTTIFSSMEKECGVAPGKGHYACIVDLLCRSGKLKEAMNIIETMPYKANSVMWGSILRACANHGDLRLTEGVAERMMELEPHSSLPYLVLARLYEMKGRWESMVRVRTAMKHKSVNEAIGCSFIGIKDHVYIFKSDQLQQHGGKEIYRMLRLMIWEMEDDSCVSTL